MAPLKHAIETRKPTTRSSIKNLKTSSHQNSIFIHNSESLNSPIQDNYQSSSKPKLRVLSLFDGIGTGHLALYDLGFEIEVYYASEIDNNAINLTKYHYGNTVKHLGPIENINKTILKEIGPINLLIGGSPCTDLSMVNYRRKGIYDTNGSGNLFFDFYRIWILLRKMSLKNNHSFYWMFENVFHMELYNRNIISKFLESQPFILDSLSISPQHRKRLFWSNIPKMRDLEIELKANEINNGPILDQYLNKNLGRSANVEKITTITTKRSCLQDGKAKDPVRQNGVKTSLLITEMEVIFGFPRHYTDVGDMTISRRQKLLGKAWSVQVIKRIYENLTDIFCMKNNHMYFN